VSPSFDIVIPTVGRPELTRLLHALAAQAGPRPARVFVIDDRAGTVASLGRTVARDSRVTSSWLGARLRVVDAAAGVAHGPAAARNRGGRRSRAGWVVFLDDDVEPERGWLTMLARDLSVATALPAAASAGRIRVPLPRDRRPTDWERDVAGLERAVWATADMAYRRDVLLALDGFDEGFPLAYREDADLALRTVEAGHAVVTGERRVRHPVRRADAWISVRRQRGNASDARMRAKHGRGWRRKAHVPRGRLPVHAATTTSALGALAATVAGRRRPAVIATAAWLAATAELAWRRIAPGPRTPAELRTMVVTSVLIPPVAVWHRARGELHERIGRRRARPRFDVVLLDRDGTIVADHPYNGDPARVVPVGDAGRALQRLRAHGIRVAVVSNQSGIARGLLTHAQVRAVNRRVEELLGPFSGWWYCPHDERAACGCRKPAPGMVERALRHLAVPPQRCALVGDTEADVEAARAAGVRAVLVPNGATRVEEIERAPDVAPTLDAAARMLIGVRP
jgi:HAD superfamily hydrolase (TIGR01662 family)